MREKEKYPFLSRNLGKVGCYFLLGLSILGILIALKRLYGDLYPLLNWQGEINGSCDLRSDLPSVPNGIGMVAKAHVTGCEAWPLPSIAYTTYIYVHRVGEPDSAKSLVFRFYAASDDLKIVWTDDSNLHISISEVGDTSKQITSIGGVNISYSIDKEENSPEEIARLVKHDEELSFVWLIFSAGVGIRYLRRSAANVSLAEVLGISAIWISFVLIPVLPVLRSLFK
jgi:hypothetical protein